MAAIGALGKANAAPEAFYEEEPMLTWYPLRKQFSSVLISAISIAAARGEEAIVEHLVSECAVGINPPSNNGDYTNWITPIEAAMRGRQDNMVRLLIRLGSDLSCSSGSTALHIAAAVGSTHLFQELFDAGCDMGHKDSAFNTPISYAVSSPQYEETVRYLLELGATMDLRDLRLLIYSMRFYERYPADDPVPFIRNAETLEDITEAAQETVRGNISKVFAKEPRILHIFQGLRNYDKSLVANIPRSFNALVDRLLVGGFSLDINGLTKMLERVPFWHQDCPIYEFDNGSEDNNPWNPEDGLLENISGGDTDFMFESLGRTLGL
ncbi:ankyrin repeat-containing domain protein [Dactylonectria macrodidyma]|uniref:Ankyrin repeat-containing domain protein n=1 Tax=Dactylonectria macrodidyma TaxID=307937 RepID=A0A9P9DAR6_9HYPO|nr:ankyrin repeat-containing domain protein [Dactylonectria macrodidyma]